MRSAVTISLINEARGGPFVYWDDLGGSIRKAAALGFDAVEIFAPNPVALVADAIMDVDLTIVDRSALRRTRGAVKPGPVFAPLGVQRLCQSRRDAEGRKRSR